jgi:hypothetical protein
LQRQRSLLAAAGAQPALAVAESLSALNALALVIESGVRPDLGHLSEIRTSILDNMAESHWLVLAASLLCRRECLVIPPSQPPCLALIICRREHQRIL